MSRRRLAFSDYCCAISHSSTSLGRGHTFWLHPSTSPPAVPKLLLKWTLVNRGRGFSSVAALVFFPGEVALHLAAQRGVTSSPRVRSWLSRMTVVCVGLCCFYRPRTAYSKQLTSGAERLHRGPSPNCVERPCPTVCRGPIGRDRADRLTVVVRQLCERLDIGTDPRIGLFRGAKSRIPCRHSSQGPRESSKQGLYRCAGAALESVASRLCHYSRNADWNHREGCVTQAESRPLLYTLS